MANRSEKVEFYVTPNTKQAIRRAADEADQSISSWCASRIDELLRDRAVEAAADQYNAEQRIEELVTRTTDEIEAAAEDLRETQIKAAVYSIANWELLKDDSGEAHRREALTTGADRIRGGPLTVEFDVDAGITEESVSQVESTVSADQANADSPAASTEESNAGSDGTGDNELDSLDEEWWQT